MSNIIIYSSNKNSINDVPYEVVERKGVGHPDNLCDAVAEKISIEYSKYCLDKYGVILRHMADKVSLLGGASKVSFGDGEMIEPIRLLLNARFTKVFNGEEIPYKKIVEDVIHSHFKEIFPLLDTNRWLKIIDNVHFNEGPGVVYDNNRTRNDRHDFFEVKTSSDIDKHTNGYRTNDTSTTVSYSPLSNLERIVILIEQLLNSKDFKQKHEYIGTDIKVMGKRIGNNLEMTLCVPFIAKYTPNASFYKEKLEWLRGHIVDIVKSKLPTYNVSIYLNTRDNFDKDDIYLTAIGSAIESGDEGAVGRGNRYNGVIPFTRHMTTEAPCGKNPVYHTGKIFTAIGSIIADKIYKVLDLENTVYLTSQMGGDMTRPWQIAVDINKKHIDEETKSKIYSIINKWLSAHKDVTNKIINYEIKVF